MQSTTTYNILRLVHTLESLQSKGDVTINQVNEAIRQRLAETGVKQWQVAEMMGINEFSFSRALRHELPPELRDQVIDAINAVKAAEVERRETN